MKSINKRNLIQINGDVWRLAFTDFIHKRGEEVDYYTESTYPADAWEHEEWYNDQLLFDAKCGIQRCWLNDYLEEDLFGYDIVDEKRFLLAKVKYAF